MGNASSTFCPCLECRHYVMGPAVALGLGRTPSKPPAPVTRAPRPIVTPLPSPPSIELTPVFSVVVVKKKEEEEEDKVSDGSPVRRLRNHSVSCVFDLLQSGELPLSLGIRGWRSALQLDDEGRVAEAIHEAVLSGSCKGSLARLADERRPSAPARLATSSDEGEGEEGSGMQVAMQVEGQGAGAERASG